jgi:hypothetical protein
LATFQKIYYGVAAAIKLKHGGTVAKQSVVKLIDDLDGSEATETVLFTLDGVEYSIDLGPKNLKKFRDALSVYVAKARKKNAVGRKSKTVSGTKARVKAPKVDAQAIRDWARAQGHDVSQRGRIPHGLVVQFQEAH